MTDLFNTPELIPDNVRQILRQEAESYEELDNLIARVNELGYTFDYDLHCEPYNLRKLDNNNNYLTPTP